MTGCTSDSWSGLDYKDPRLQPFEAFQQFKHHPSRQAVARRRRDPGCRRTHHCRRRLAVAAETRDAGCAADRGRRRHAQRAQDQGHSSGDTIRRAVPRNSWPRHGVAAGFDARWRATRRRHANCTGAQYQARLQARLLVPGFANGGAGDADRRPHALDARQPRRRCRAVEAPGRLCIARSALGDAHAAAARPAVVGVLCRQHARGGATGASEGCRHLDLRRPLRHRSSAIPASASVRRTSTRWSTTAPAASAADQRRQLRALQGLRHQGPLRHHHLDHARGRFRPNYQNL